jgi:hypothetical protein
MLRCWHLPGSAVTCNDGDICTIDYCIDPEIGCQKRPQDANFCDDGIACTETVVSPAGQDTDTRRKSSRGARVGILRSSLTEIAVRASVACGALSTTHGELRRASGWPRGEFPYAR